MRKSHSHRWHTADSAAYTFTEDVWFIFYLGNAHVTIQTELEHLTMIITGKHSLFEMIREPGSENK